MYPTAQISSIPDLVNIAVNIYEEAQSDIWWRGQACFKWQLVAGVHREDHGARYEKNIVQRFIMRAPARHKRLPRDKDYATWLFLMQHYRLPTRLLDWTESALIAVFFAVSESEHLKQAGSLWALNPYVLNKRFCDRHAPMTADSPEVVPIFRPAFSDDSPEFERVAAVTPSHVDQRILNQLGVFTVHGMRTPLDDHPHASEFLRMYEIPAAAKEVMRLELHMLGIRRSSLFPDLENLALELKDKNFL
jgi:hypothetical protein